MADKIIVNSLEFKKNTKKFNVQTYCIYNPLNKKKLYKNPKKNYFSFFKKNTTNFIILVDWLTKKTKLLFLNL